MKKNINLLVLLFIGFGTFFVITCCLYSEAITFNIDPELSNEMFKNISVGIVSSFSVAILIEFSYQGRVKKRNKFARKYYMRYIFSEFKSFQIHLDGLHKNLYQITKNSKDYIDYKTIKGNVFIKSLSYEIPLIEEIIGKSEEEMTENDSEILLIFEEHYGNSMHGTDGVALANLRRIWNKQKGFDQIKSEMFKFEYYSPEEISDIEKIFTLAEMCYIQIKARMFSNSTIKLEGYKSLIESFEKLFKKIPEIKEEFPSFSNSYK